MSRLSDEWQYDAYEKNRTKFIDRFAAFLEQPENWIRLKEVEQTDDLRQLLTEAFNVIFPNPYKKTNILGYYYSPDLDERTKEIAKMKDKFMSVNGKQVVVISSNDNLATVMSFPKNENMVQAFMETVAVDQLEPYKCPYADETDPTRVYCSAGICEYPVNSSSASQAMFACSQCLIKSLDAEDE